jgi:hypothetical protein
MKTKIFTLFIGLLFAMSSYAQEPSTGIILKAEVAPVIDGEIDEIWDAANKYDFERVYAAEVPTVGAPGETYWRAYWTDEGMYILVVVADDVYWPNYGEGSGDPWANDLIEVYFDVNYTLEDGLGPMTSGTGHYQVAPAFTAAKEQGLVNTDATTGVVHSFMMNNPDYLAEYFVPWSHLKNSVGGSYDKTELMGFDIVVLDRDGLDDTRRRAVWSNEGGAGEAWANMDDAGRLTFDGAQPGIWVESIDIAPATTEITTDNGTIQFAPVILPEDATDKTLSWTVENLTGRATISSTGLLTAVLDGEVSVSCQATDGSFTIAEPVTITISNQYVWSGELNIIKNGNFSQVDANSKAAFWGNYVDGTFPAEAYTIVDGAAVFTPVGADENWKYNFTQTSQFKAVPNEPYIFSFVAWADAEEVDEITLEPITMQVDFEDVEATGYRRYGASPQGVDQRSEWFVELTDEPTTFTFDVTFDEILPTTPEKVQFMVGKRSVVTYIDNVSLISVADLLLADAVSVPTTEASAKVTVSPVPAVDVINVAGAIANASVEVYNSVGQKVAVVKADANGAAVVSVSSLAKGLYFVRTSGAVVKFVK